MLTAACSSKRHKYVEGHVSIRVAVKIPFRKIMLNRVETVFVIPRKKVLLSEFRVSRKSPFGGLKVIHVFFFVFEWFGTSFQRFFLLLIGSERNFECFSLR
jgi:hypothetical protein